MAQTFTIDEITGKTASLAWLDDKGDKGAKAPDGVVVSNWTSSNTAVATIDPASGVITGVGLGDTDLSATATSADGTTTFPVTADTLTIDAGAGKSAIVQIA